MLTQHHGVTIIMYTSYIWSNMYIYEIFNFRFQLVRGKYITHIRNFNGKIIEKTIEIALAENSPDAEIEFKTKPVGRIILNDEVQPFGPSAQLLKLDIGNYKINKKIEKAYYDTDLKAKDAILNLYKSGVLISKIQKAFSVGAFGLEKNRKFVPTRWSITAVDSTISKSLIENTKNYPLINGFQVYEHTQLDNRWIVLMLPREWCFELIEAWYPNTLWNPGKNIEIFSDYEFFDGRKDYPSIGGCYFASRLAVNELLNKEKRQAGVVVLREAHPGYIMPVGVWNVREAVRNALKNKPLKFNSLNEALNYVSKKLDIPISKWISCSAILKDTLQQRKITEFFKVKKNESKRNFL
ncbi:MAG: hypothetical protein QXD43_03965 [Candidatus Aenigmatarchaeota archaeon]